MSERKPYRHYCPGNAQSTSCPKSQSFDKKSGQKSRGKWRPRSIDHVYQCISCYFVDHPCVAVRHSTASSFPNSRTSRILRSVTKSTNQQAPLPLPVVDSSSTRDSSSITRLAAVESDLDDEVPASQSSISDCEVTEVQRSLLNTQHSSKSLLKANIALTESFSFFAPLSKPPPHLSDNAWDSSFYFPIPKPIKKIEQVHNSLTSNFWC